MTPTIAVSPTTMSATPPKLTGDREAAGGDLLLGHSPAAVPHSL